MVKEIPPAPLLVGVGRMAVGVRGGSLLAAAVGAVDLRSKGVEVCRWVEV